MTIAFEELEAKYLSELKRVTEAFTSLREVMGPISPLSPGASVPVLSQQQLDAQEEASAASAAYEAARDEYWARRSQAR